MTSHHISQILYGYTLMAAEINPGDCHYMGKLIKRGSISWKKSGSPIIHCECEKDAKEETGAVLIHFLVSDNCSQRVSWKKVLAYSDWNVHLMPMFGLGIEACGCVFRESPFVLELPCPMFLFQSNSLGCFRGGPGPLFTKTSYH